MRRWASSRSHPQRVLMRGCNQNCSGLAAALDSGGDIQTFAINRNGNNMTTIQIEDVARKTISRIFHPDAASAVQQDAGGNLQRLLRTADDHDLIGFALYSSGRPNVGSNRFAKAL